MTTIRTIIKSVTDGVIRLFNGTGDSADTDIAGEFIQQVGFRSRPKAGHSGIVIRDGNRDYIIATDNDDGPELEENERVFYFDAANYIKFVVVGGVLQKIHVITEKDVAVEATGKVDVTAPNINLTGAVNITGPVTVTGNISATGTIIDGAGNTNNHSH